MSRGICEYCHRARPLVRHAPQACDRCVLKADHHEATKKGPYPKTIIIVGEFSVPPRCSQCRIWARTLTALPQVNDAGDMIGQWFYCDACYEVAKQADPYMTGRAAIPLPTWLVA